MFSNDLNKLIESILNLYAAYIYIYIYIYIYYIDFT